MTRHHSRTLILGLALTGVACTAAMPSQGRHPFPSSRAIRVAELETPGLVTIYDAVRTLRPQWLRQWRWLQITSDGQPRATPLKVYVQHLYCSGIECLQALLVETVVEVRYLSAADRYDPVGPWTYDPRDRGDPARGWRRGRLRSAAVVRAAGDNSHPPDS